MLWYAHVGFFCILYVLLHMQEASQAKAANDAAVNNKQDIADGKLTSDSDTQIGIGHVDVVKSAAAGRYTAAVAGQGCMLHRQSLHAYAA